jgi:hypothetical protein
MMAGMMIARKLSKCTMKNNSCARAVSTLLIRKVPMASVSSIYTIHTSIVGQHHTRQLYSTLSSTNTATANINTTPKQVWDIKWDFHFDKLVQYRAKYGDCLVPARYMLYQGEEIFHRNADLQSNLTTNLGSWVVFQRTQQRQGLLRQDRVQRLNSINFVWDISAYYWNMKYQLLVKYYVENGHSSVPWLHKVDNSESKLIKSKPSSPSVPSNIKSYSSSSSSSFYSSRPTAKGRALNDSTVELGGWVRQQRQDYLEGRLDKEKIMLLNKLDFYWNVHDAHWEANYRALVRYSKVHGNCDVPLKLRCFANSTFEKRDIDNSFDTGGVNVVDEEEEEENVEDKKEVMRKQRKGKRTDGKDGASKIVAMVASQESLNLGTWLRKMRHAYKHSKLSSSDVLLMEQIPNFTWQRAGSVRTPKKWFRNFSILVKYFQRHRNHHHHHKPNNENEGGLLKCEEDDTYNDIPSSFIDEETGIDIGRWAHHQRSRYHSNRLPEVLATKLMEAGLVLDLHEKAWQLKFKKLEIMLKNKYIVEKGSSYFYGPYRAKLKSLSDPTTLSPLNQDDMKIGEENRSSSPTSPSSSSSDSHGHSTSAYQSTTSTEVNMEYSLKELSSMISWVRRQRALMRDGKLSKARVEQLVNAGVSSLRKLQLPPP